MKALKGPALLVLVAALFAGCDGIIDWVAMSDLNQVEKRELASVAGAVYVQTDGTAAFQHDVSGFRMARYEVTYRLWYVVLRWSLNRGYRYEQVGREGNDGEAGAPPTPADGNEPVTCVTFRDALVWCNAYSQAEILTPCYTYNGDVVFDATDHAACDAAVCTWSANGFRLPSEGEWQRAASQAGAVPYNFASGAAAACTDTADVLSGANGVPDGKDASDPVSIYYLYLDFDNVTWLQTGVQKTAVTGSKTANALGLFDLSGNVSEWCWDHYAAYPGDSADYHGPGSGASRVTRGGAWSLTAQYLGVGFRTYGSSDLALNNLGFRVVRTN